MTLADRRLKRSDFLKLSGAGLAGGLLLGAAGCGSGGSASGSSGGSGGGGSERVATQLFWFPEPEHGNIFGAREGGIYEENGLEMEILGGGPEISATQIVASGQAEFGMGDADSIALGQQEGIPLVAIAANFQTNPQILMYHQGADIQQPEDISGRTVYIAPTANYWKYIKDEYGIEPKKEVAFSGSLAPFIDNEEAVNQAYITSEPYKLEEERDIPIDYFLNADLGYNPYVVLFTTERMIQESPETVRSYVEASMRGWDYYFENTERVNQVIHEENPDLSLEQMAYSAETERPLIYTDATEENGLGHMSEERWATLVDQLVQIGSLEEPIEPSTLYTNEFLPQS